MEKNVKDVLARLLVSSGRPVPGQGLVEYGLIIVLVAVAVVLGLGAFGVGLNDFFSSLVDGMPF